jgi:16S rRNA (uracil1498-N3)-methyltransferase
MASNSLNAPLRHSSTLSEGAKISLDRQHVRALEARGIKVKEAFTIIDHDGHFFRASLKGMDKRGGKAVVYEQMHGSTESPARITLLCAVLDRQRMMVVMQKATELGVARIIPVLSERSVKRDGLEHQKAHAWPNQTLRAARQCRRASVPEVRVAQELKAALDERCFKDADLRVYLDDRAADINALAGASGTERPNRSIAFAVGPEGGWSDGERQLLEARGTLPLRLGGRVLRAETAVLVGLTLLQHVYGDMGVGAPETMRADPELA